MMRLHAADLWSKWGFHDGNIQSNHPDEDIAFSDYDALIPAVRKYLLPLLPDVEVEEWESHHNPIRAKTFADGCPDQYLDVYVDVTFEQWAELVKELAK